MSLRMTLTDARDRQGRNIWRLDEDYACKIGTGCTVIVPAGFLTNFGTVPRFFWRLISPQEMREASLVHDYLCNEVPLDQVHELPKSGYSRWIADAVLYQAMTDMQIAGPIRRFLVFAAVRLFAIVKGVK